MGWPPTMFILAIYILTFTVGFPANIFTFATLLGKARRRVSSSDILLLNLTAADLLLLLFLPFKMVEAAAGMSWPLPVVLCPVANFCFFSSIYLSSLFLAALSVERYLGVVFPLHYKDRRRPGRAMAASVVLWLLACSHCSIVFVSQYHGGRNQTVNNRSVANSSDGSTVNGFKLGGSKMPNLEGFDPNDLIITSPDGLNSNGFSVSNPGYSINDGFNHTRSKISTADGFNPGVFKVSTPNDSITDGFDSRGSGILIRDVINPKAFKISNPNDSKHNGFVPRDSKTTNGAISAHGGSRISSNPSSPKTSNRHIPAHKISALHGANIRDVSGPTVVPRTSNTPSSSAPSTQGSSSDIYRCYDDFSSEQLSFVLPLRLELFLILFLLPFAVTIFCYTNFVRALLARPNIPLEKKQRAVGLAVATMINFGVCFAPYNISHVVGFVKKQSPDWRVYVLLLTSLNAALDPVIFYFSSTAVQRAMAGVVVAVREKLRVVVGSCYGAWPPTTSRDESEGSLT
ncbi:free fatty acid receptor 3-like isoform X2 [Phalacrocorax carbo]|uniref:free fatty acid receptor 3-like isoform X2 n=1 Tax=Phalacrocorax carbo TaxID=9209 RepID=UPI0031191610